jgi:hypothetical protein
MPTEEHEFFAQPGNAQPWCFCRTRDCPGWAAYLAWYRDDAGEDSDPDGDVVEAHKRITRVLGELTSRYSRLLGVEVGYNDALDLAAAEKAAEATAHGE